MSSVDDINAFLDAYTPSDVKAALRERNARMHMERKASEWKPWNGEGVPPKPYEYREINGVIQYREPVIHKPGRIQSIAAPERTKESVTSIPCPGCGAIMFKEGICPSCEDGKKGYRIRLLCGECDRVELL